MWVKAVGAPADSYPLEIDDHQVRIYDIKRVLPANCSAGIPGGGCVHPVTGVPGGMVWNVTGVLSFSHGSWELAPRHEYDFEGVESISADNSDVVRATLSQILQFDVMYGNSDTATLGGYPAATLSAQKLGVREQELVV